MKRAIILPIIFSVILIGITANYATAAIIVTEEGIVTDIDGDFYAWSFTGTTSATTLVVTNVCGNTADPTEILDPILFVQSPTMMKDDDDSFTDCDLNAPSSIVTFNVNEVMDGCWVTQADGFSDTTGPYTLTLDLSGPGTITSLGLTTALDVCTIPVGGTYIPIDTTSLLLAGAASVSMWMIPVVLAGAGIGVFVIKRR